MRQFIITAMFLLLFSSAGYGSDWQHIFTAPTGGEWFYDTKNITHGEYTTVVWTKWVLSDNERAKFTKEFPILLKKEETIATSAAISYKKTNELTNKSYFIQKTEINCSKNVAKIISISIFDSSGELIWFSGDQQKKKFEDVFPDIKGDALIKAICKDSEGGK